MWTPLDCAASRGWTKCAEALLDGDSPIDPMDWGKVGNIFNCELVDLIYFGASLLTNWYLLNLRSEIKMLRLE